MGGKYILKSQADYYMKLRNNKLTQDIASIKSGISTRSGRTIEQGQHYTCKPLKPRKYKTRKSPIDEVWESELEPMLRLNPNLQPKSLFLHLQRTHLDKDNNPIYTSAIERSLQRKVARWRALNGNSKDIIFPQIHIPGEQGLSDFTNFNNTVVNLP